jgi:hypothetical protein
MVGMKDMSPDTSGILTSPHVELVNAIQSTTNKSPVHKVARVMDPHAGKPLECRSGDVMVITHTTNRRVWIEAAKDRI